MGGKLNITKRAGGPSPAAGGGRGALLDAIRGGASLKKAPKPSEKPKVAPKAAGGGAAGGPMNMAAMAAALAQKRKANASDLMKKLEQRPSKQELEQKNIMPEGGVFAANKIALKRAQDKDNLNSKIANRPALEDLEKKGVIKQADDDMPEWMKKRRQKLSESGVTE